MVHFEFPQKSSIQNSFIIKITSGDKSFFIRKRHFLNGRLKFGKAKRNKLAKIQFYKIDFFGTFGFHSPLKYFCMHSL